jgi:hypothetical protein
MRKEVYFDKIECAIYEGVRGSCSDLAGNLNEIRNITHVRGLVTLFIELPS